MEETGEQAANTLAAGHVLRKETKVRAALAWQSLNKVNNIWKSDFAEKKGGSYSDQLRRQFSFTGVTLAPWQSKKPGWNLYKKAANGDKHTLEEQG